MCLLAELWGDLWKALDGDGEGGSQGIFFLGLGLWLGEFILLREAVVGSMKLLVNWAGLGPSRPSWESSGVVSSSSELSREASRGNAGKTSDIPGDGVAVLTEELTEKGEMVEPVDMI